MKAPPPGRAADFPIIRHTLSHEYGLTFAPGYVIIQTKEHHAKCRQEMIPVKRNNRIVYRLLVLSLSVLLLTIPFSACKKDSSSAVKGLQHITTKEKDQNEPVVKKPSLGLEYILNVDKSTSKHDGTCQVNGIGTCKDTDLLIPSSLYSKGTVVGVADAAFKDCTKITSVTIPDGVTSIGAEAFAGCTGLRSVSIPDSVTIIGADAFADCPNLPYNHVNGADYLGNEENPYVVLIRVTNKSVTSFSIPEQVKIIYSDAFSDCTQLMSVTIPEGVKRIGVSAFAGCVMLTEISVPDSVTNLEEKAFFGCSGIRAATVGTGVTKIGESVFAGCDSMETLTVPFIGDTANESSNPYLDYFFGGTLHVTPENLKTVVQEAVPLTLRKVILTSGERVGNYAFMGCPGLTSVTVSDRMVEIGMFAFYRCSGLTEVVISQSVTAIGIDAFRECTALTEITIPDQVTDIGGLVFYGCAELQKITIGKNVQALVNYVLGNCPALTEIHYTGTRTEWEAIKKDHTWDADRVSGYTVICSDGTISK